ncbi:hypothetical protein D3C78_1948720 [compost metagenome]
MPGESIKIKIQLPDIYLHMRCALRSVDNDDSTIAMSNLRNLLNRVNNTEYIGNVSDRNNLRLGRNGFLDILDCD